MFDTIETQNPNKIAPWIVGGMAVIVAGIAVVAWLDLLWLIPLFILAGAMASWRYRREWVRITLIYACILSVVIIAAYNVRERRDQKAEAEAAAANEFATVNAKIPKPPAGAPATPPITAPPDQAKEFADMKAALDKANAAIATLQAHGTGNQGRPAAGATGDESDGNTGSVAVAQPPDDLSGKLPNDVEPGEEGPLPVKAKNCWYSGINEMTCRFFVVNKERQSRIMDVMDSNGTTSNDEESRRFITWRSGGAIRYAGGDNRAVLIHNVKNDILITFAEPDGGVNKVSFTLNLSGVPDAIPHQYDFANIPVVDHWH